MPIYEYRCDSCGFQKEYLRRMTDAPLTDCPECKKPTFNKMVTAAGFQLKGGGWYVTDFKGGGTPPGGKKSEGNQSDTASKADAPAAASSAAETPKAASTTPTSSTSSSSGTS